MQLSPRLLPLFLGLGALAVACGGGGDDDGGGSADGGTTIDSSVNDGDGGGVFDAGPPGDADTTAPTLLSSAPADDATDVAVDTTISATFSEPIASSSVTASSFTVVDDTSTTVTGALSVSGDTVTFTPDADLRLDRTYTITISTAVTDMAGNALAAEASFDFATHLRAWSSAAPVDTTATGSVAAPRPACSADGTAVLTWLIPGDAGNNVSASRYVSGSGWSTPPTTLDSAFDTTDSPAVAMSSSGDAIAVWSQPSGGADSIWQASMSGTSGNWAAAAVVEVNSSSAQRPDIAISGDGTGFVVWPEHDGTRWNVWSSISGGTWTAAGLESSDMGADDPVVAADGSGNAVAMWNQRIGNTNLFASRYVNGTGWITPEPLGASTATREIHVAMTATGDIVAVWRQVASNVGSIWSARYTSAGGWSTPEAIESEVNDAEAPRVAVDSAGNAVAVWQQSDGSRENIWANRYEVGVGWGTAGAIEALDTGDASTPDVAIDKDGNAMAIFRVIGTSVFDVWVARHTPGAGWGAPVMLETEDGNASQTRICFGRGGTSATASWRQLYGPTARVVSARFE